jgi:hypothetical protein
MSDLELTLIRPGKRALVLVDFAFASAGLLCDLLSGGDSGYGLYRIDAVSDFGGGARRRPLGQLAAEYAALVVAELGTPAAVVGHCGASILALRVADALLARGAVVPTVLVDAAWITDRHLTECLDDARDRLGASRHADPPPPTSFTLESALEILARDVEATFRSDGVDDAELADCVPMLLERYEAFFGFLVLSRDEPVPSPATPTTLVVSSASESVPAHWPSTIEVHEVAATRYELAHNAAARTAILGVAGS